MDSNEIRKRIPHRDPFLWLDEVLELSETRITARRFLSPDLPVFAGHYPGFPVFPGVLQCEACFQAAAVLISGLVTPDAGQVPVVTRQDKTQFRKLIRPGDTLCIEVEITERLANAYFLKGKILVDGKVSTRLEFACALAEGGA
ncbi:MAG: beta-hydroxyacyl-ACP dehydratase [Fuerstiella sp.]|nr:beta-hydroxyacyl-ACP dehydratase [Fuerstiella sp.]